MSSSIQGINVQGNTSVVEVELAERVAQLAAVKLLEEQERARRMYIERRIADFELRVRNNASKTVIAWEATELLRREMDLAGEGFRKQLAREVSALIVAYWASFSISTETLTEAVASGKEILNQAGDKALETTMSATEAILDKAQMLGDLVLRAAAFFGLKAKDLGETAVVKGQILGAKAAEKAQELGAAAVENIKVQGHIVRAKTIELGTKAVADAQEFGQQLGAVAAEKIHQLGAKAVEKTGELIRSGKQAAQAAQEAETVNDSLASATENIATIFDPWKDQSLTWEQLTTLEELERNHRMKERLVVESFLLALATSNIIKNLEGYRAVEINRWYATAVLEEFERKRRFLEDRLDNTAIRNAHTIAYFVLTHPSIKSRYATSQAPAVLAPASEPTIVKTGVSYVVPVTGLAAM